MIELFPNMATAAAFAAVCAALYVAPGVDMIYLASRAIGQGRFAGVLSALGIFASICVHLTAAALGLAVLFELWPVLYHAVRWAGVAYLAWLGFQALANRGGLRIPAPGETVSPVGGLRIVRQAALGNLLNPKMAIFFVAFLPQFVDPARGDPGLQMLLYGLLFNLGGLAWNLSLAVLFGSLGDWLRHRPGVLAVQRWFTGLTLLGLAAYVAANERR